jgi:Site-specific recombinases, DNA invertase Pin homologs
MAAKNKKINDYVPKVFGYLRVSTKEQNLENNKLAILKLAEENHLSNVIFLEEKVSGRKDWRVRLLGTEFEKMNKGDYILISEQSRLGRDFMNSVHFLAEARMKGIIVLSVSNDIPLKDDATSQLLCSLAAWRSGVERELISARTKRALQSRKEAGKILGRPRGKSKLDPYIEDIRDFVLMGVKQKNLAEKYECSEITMGKFIKQHNLRDLKTNKQEKLEIIIEAEGT